MPGSAHSRRIDRKDEGRTKVLFFFPPVWDVGSPYLSIPQLAACLEEQGVSVQACDLNLEIARWMLSPEGTGELQKALETTVRSRRLPKRSFFELSAWVRRWCDDLPEDHRAASRILKKPQSFSAREYYRAHDLIKRCWNIIHALEAANHHDARIIPPHFRRIQSLIDGALRWKPDIVGFSIITHRQLVNVVGYADYIRREYRDVRLLIGGPASTIAFGTVFDESQVPSSIDCCVLGHGEGALSKLIGMCSEGKAWPRILNGGDRPLGAPFLVPKYGCLPVDRYFSVPRDFSYALSEGCYWRRCSYCSKKTVSRYMARPGPIVAEQMKGIEKKFGCGKFFNAGSALAPKDALDIAESIRKLKLDVRWNTLVRPERGWTKARFEQLKASGLRGIQFGVESLSDDVLRAMNRGLLAGDQLKAIESACDCGLKPTLFLIFDLPMETPDDFVLTLDRITPYVPFISNIVLSGFQLFSDSDIAADPGKFGITTAPSSATLFGSNLFSIDILKNKQDKARATRKWMAWDKWINGLHQNRSLLFLKADQLAMVLFDDDLLFGDRVRERPVNSGYFRLSRILDRKYHLNPRRIKKLKDDRGKTEYVLRDQIRVVGRRRESLKLLGALEVGTTVGEAMKLCGISVGRDASAYNMMIQFINTLDLLGVLVPLS
ncbi:MAG: radical SAM protein [Pseudomonadota bacterium]